MKSRRIDEQCCYYDLNRYDKTRRKVVGTGGSLLHGDDSWEKGKVDIKLILYRDEIYTRGKPSVKGDGGAVVVGKRVLQFTTSKVSSKLIMRCII